MAAHTNESGALLILPDGTQIAPGAEATINAETAKGSGVAEWLEKGWLVPVAKPKSDK